MTFQELVFHSYDVWADLLAQAYLPQTLRWTSMPTISKPGIVMKMLRVDEEPDAGRRDRASCVESKWSSIIQSASSLCLKFGDLVVKQLRVIEKLVAGRQVHSACISQVSLPL